MQAIRIIINSVPFLLPDGFDYEFPAYILAHKEQILQLIDEGKKAASDPLNYQLVPMPDLAEFKRTTGIIGYPFDMRDPDLYAAEQVVEIIMEMEI